MNKFILVILIFMIAGCQPRTIVSNVDEIMALLDKCEIKFDEACSMQPIPDGVSDEVMIQFYTDYYNSKLDK